MTIVLGRDVEGKMSQNSGIQIMKSVPASGYSSATPSMPVNDVWGVKESH